MANDKLKAELDRKIISKLRQQAINKLRQYGIENEDVYLIDFIPLIKIMWADGIIQKSELQIFNEYVKKHVAHINEVAGYKIMTISKAKKFINRFLNKNEQDEELLNTLLFLIKPVRLSTSDSNYNESVRNSILSFCIDIASSAVKEPCKNILHDRFCLDEKLCYFEILDALKKSD